MVARLALLFLSAQAVLGLRRGRLQNSSASCGLRGSTSGSSFTQIINGQDAQQCDWIWQVQLKTDRQGVFCGGTLISDRWVLTAAHCVSGVRSKSLEVILGNYNRVGLSSGAVIRRVRDIMSHPSFNPRYMRNNIALVELDSPVESKGCIGTVCFPEADAPLADDTECWVTGWGITEIGDYDALPQHLQEVKLNTVPQSKCKSAYAEEYFTISEDMLCANGQGSDKKEWADACHGDYGGPLVCQTGGAWFLHGVSSFSFGCAEGTLPGVWARTAYQREWIESIAGSIFF